MPRSSARYSARYSEGASVADGNAIGRGRGETGEVDQRQQTGDHLAAPKNRGLLRKRGRHIAAQVVTQGASLTSVQARAMKAGRVTTPDFPWIARFSASTVNSQLRSNEAGARR